MHTKVRWYQEIHISELDTFIPPTQWNKLHRMQYTLLSSRDFQRSVKYPEEERSQHHWAQIKKRPNPTWVFYCRPTQAEVAVGKGQITCSRVVAGYGWGHPLVGGKDGKRERGQGEWCHYLVLAFHTCWIPARVFINRLIPTRCIVSRSNFSNSLSRLNKRSWCW